MYSIQSDKNDFQHFPNYLQVECLLAQSRKERLQALDNYRYTRLLSLLYSGACLSYTVFMKLTGSNDELNQMSLSGSNGNKIYFIYVRMTY